MPKTESYRNRIVSMRSVSNFLLEFENKAFKVLWVSCSKYWQPKERSWELITRCVAGEMDQNEMSKLMIFQRLEKIRMTCTRWSVVVLDRRASSLRHGSRLPSSANYCFLLIYTSAACISGYGRYSLDLSWPSTPNIERTRHAQTVTNCDNKSRVAVKDGRIGKYCSGLASTPFALLFGKGQVSVVSLQLPETSNIQTAMKRLQVNFRIPVPGWYTD